eukprot:1179136-Prorocentrum_minimum.AAC.2
MQERGVWRRTSAHPYCGDARALVKPGCVGGHRGLRSPAAGGTNSSGGAGRPTVLNSRSA